MKVKERFLNYISFPTQSDHQSQTSPSTPGQLVLADCLAAELKELGAVNVERDSCGYVYATVPASAGCENAPVLALLSHMDTAEEASGDHIRPRIIENYDGQDIVLNKELGIVTGLADFPFLSDLKGDELIVTDGTTLLGGDDKAGIAEIMEAVSFLTGHAKPEDYIKTNLTSAPKDSTTANPQAVSAGLKDFPHPEIRIIFTPDEEICRSISNIDMAKIGAAYGYTMDGSGIGALKYENFNAVDVEVHVKGKAVHPGSAYKVMKNASLMAAEYASGLPENETPAGTKDREGFYHLTEMNGAIEQAYLHYIVRDFEKEGLRKRWQVMEELAQTLNQKYGPESFTLIMHEQYFNMIEKILPDHKELIDAAEEAIISQGLSYSSSPIRGGTDGAMLSFKGLPCPNLGIGTYAVHGPHELVSVTQMEKAVIILLEIIRRLSGKMSDKREE